MKDSSVETNGPTNFNCKVIRHKTLELVRFKIISNLLDNVSNGIVDWKDDCCPVIGLRSTPSGDCFLCSIHDGSVAVLHLSEIQSIDLPTVYFPHSHTHAQLVDGKESNLPAYESTVDEIVFSPFDQDIFFLRWSDGSLGLFHRKDSVAAIYWNSWNYLPTTDSITMMDVAISVQWCQRRPCTFYILSKVGYFLTFDLSKGQCPVKFQKISFDNKGLANLAFEHLSLIPSYSSKVLPFIILKSKEGHLFGMKQMMEEEGEVEQVPCDVELEYNTLKRIFFHDRITLN